MKRNANRWAAFCLPLSLLLTACGGTEAAEQAEVTTDGADVQHNVIFTAKSMPDYAHIAGSVAELAEDSDFIAEIKVKNIASYVYPHSDEIHTQVTPEIIQLYKGSYQDQPLDVYGGYMDYTDYVDQAFSSQYDTLHVDGLTEEELQSGEVYYNLCNCHIPEIGDTLLFFGTISEDGSQIAVTNTYQGLFLCDGDTLTNPALIVENSSGWQEPLVQDILQQCSDVTIAAPANTACDQSKVLSMPQNIFTACLQENLQ